MTKKEFLKNYVLEDELNEFLSSKHDAMYFYCVDDDNRGMSVCRFLKDSTDENVIDYDEFDLHGLDTAEKWRNLMLENDFILPEGVNIWWEGIDQFLDYLSREYKWDPPLMYESEWVPDVYEYIELENEKEK